ncbi:peptidylprolyl isomerase [Plebeiibacterium sediminum]|uniref:Peptidyl-prolyl cis-trans isomerase n=1 Tax=Plebeiibacterium sediminum TaxID=2992112 RepID=A0AAE3M180_9BACT|nr:peptidylprolyl isomerase [Plebeiobacterium sediminum]MCW3785016.1 peptidylprolyl isomerase [Plebeiobacterium sediminum]
MNKNAFLLLVAFIVIFFTSCSPKSAGTVVLLKTDLGDIKIRLYDDTPKHRDNFIKLAKEGYLDSTLFHRVIKEFMIQGGDPDSKHAESGVALGEGGPDYTIPAEFNFPKYFHKKGALAAARMGDQVNPEKASSGSQFYIVQGKVFDDNDLIKAENRIRDGKRRAIFNDVLQQYNDSLNMLQMQGEEEAIMKLQQKIMAIVNQKYSEQPEFEFPEEVKEIYKTVGGVPHLDTNYTVFGEVIEDKNWIEKIKSVFGKKYGLEVVDAIAYQETDARDRPLKDIRMKVKIIKE